MRRAAAISLVVLTFYPVPTRPQQPSPTGIIEGIVVRDDTGQPIAGAQVTLAPATIATLAGVAPVVAGTVGTLVAGTAGGGAAAGNQLPAITTPAPPPGGAPAVAPPRTAAQPPPISGADGKFVLRNIPAGSYRIIATATGFVRTEYGQRAPNGQGLPVFVSAGQTLKDAVLRMTPTGTISGRVFDENGQPAIGATVQLVRILYNIQGKYYQVVGTGAADDRGDYRIYGVSPGRYYLLAGTPLGVIRPMGGAPGGPSSSTRYSVVYYPAAATFEESTTVEVKPGREASFDMRVQRQSQTYRVRGRVVDATGKGLPANLSIGAAYRTFSGTGSFSNGRGFDPATGTFELQNIPPGDYTLQVQVPDPNPPRGGGPANGAGVGYRQAAQAALPSGQTPIHVDKDVENVVITLSNSVTAGGRFVVEGQPITALPNIQQFSLAFGVNSPTLTGPIPVGLPAQSDGTFQVVGLREGEYRVTVRGSLNAGTAALYVKSVQYGGQDILSRPFKFSGGGSGEFQVVLRPGPGQIAGSVTNAKSQPVPGIQVLAIPMERNRTLDYRPTITDQNGHYSMTGLTPGDYQLFSWEPIDNGAYFDPDFLRAYERQGKSVHVAESSSQNVDLRLIPAP